MHSKQLVAAGQWLSNHALITDAVGEQKATANKKHATNRSRWRTDYYFFSFPLKINFIEQEEYISLSLLPETGTDEKRGE